MDVQFTVGLYLSKIGNMTGKFGTKVNSYYLKGEATVNSILTNEIWRSIFDDPLTTIPKVYEKPYLLLVFYSLHALKAYTKIDEKGNVSIVWNKNALMANPKFSLCAHERWRKCVCPVFVPCVCFVCGWCVISMYSELSLSGH